MKNIISSRLHKLFLALSVIILIETAYLFFINGDIKLASLNRQNQSNNFKICDKYTAIGNKQACWEDLIEKTLNENGLSETFKVVDYLYANEPIFSADCHGFTHQLGVKAYQIFSQNNSIEIPASASYCGFGFYHAFMEALLKSTGNAKDAREFCYNAGKQSEKSELARLSCFHGIGHGLLEDIPNPVLEGDALAIIQKPLSICQEISEAELEIDRCASGVFNVLALYYQNPNSGLKMVDSNPFHICQTLDQSYFRGPCLDQMNTFVLHTLAKGNLMRAAEYTNVLKNNDDANAAIHGLAGAYGQANVGKINYDEVAYDCNKLEARVQITCVEAFVKGLVEGGRPEKEYLEGIKFCNSRLLRDEEKMNCFNVLVWNIGEINLPQQLAMCRDLEKKYQKNCNNLQATLN